MTTSLAEVEKVVENEKARKWAEINELETRKQKTEKDIKAVAKELDETLKTLDKAKQELRGVGDDLSNRRSQWDASVKKIQESFDKREAGIKENEVKVKAKLEGAEVVRLAANQRHAVLNDATDKILKTLGTLSNSISKALTDAVEAIEKSRVAEPEKPETAKKK